MNNKKIISTRYLAYSLIGLTAILLIVVPFRIPYSISTTGKLLSDREWMIVRLTDGSISSQLINHGLNITEEIKVIQAQRGDAMIFRMNPRALQSEQVNIGDSMAAVISPELEQNIIQLRGQLAQARSSLRVSASGEKPALIAEAQELVRQTQIQVEEQERVVNRLKELLDKNLVSSQEYERAYANLGVLKVSTAIAEARLSALRTGAKSEQMAYMQSQITALEKEMDAISHKAAGYVLRSPIRGVRLQASSMDTLLTVVAQDSFFVAMLAPWHDRTALRKGLTVELKSADGVNVAFARIARIDQTSQYLNNEPLFWITAAVQSASWLESGALVNCTIRCQPMTKRQMIQRFLR